jgi:hypothetical protein
MDFLPGTHHEAQLFEQRMGIILVKKSAHDRRRHSLSLHITGDHMVVGTE